MICPSTALLGQVVGSTSLGLSYKRLPNLILGQQIQLCAGSQNGVVDPQKSGPAFIFWKIRAPAKITRLTLTSKVDALLPC
jgi:hypothetical protein